MEQVEKDIEKSIIEASINEFENSVIHSDNDDPMAEIEKAIMEESKREYWNTLAQNVLKSIDFSVINVNNNKS